jgi:hypothetical protein
MKKHTILLYSKPWRMNHELHNHPIAEGFELTTDRSCMDKADAVVFHMPTQPREDKVLNKSRKRNGQLWIFWSMECEVHRPWQYEPEILDLFDIMATYRMDSDVPFLYFDYKYPELFRKAPAPKSQFINAFISSSYNQSKRIACLEELMKHLNVHSYGNILNNRSIMDDNGTATKREHIASYKFSIAFENAIARDYVTEKFFDPLIAGSVPVYLGAPNIEDFSPADKCYINVNSFTSVKALADYLLELANDDSQYEEYLKWKRLPLRESFIEKTNIITEDPVLRLCKSIERRLYNYA